MKVRVISDLHIDVNVGYPFKLKDKVPFTIICGDISAYFVKTSKWLRQNIKRGIFVAGNHMSYNESKHSIECFQEQYNRHYPLGD